MPDQSARLGYPHNNSRGVVVEIESRARVFQDASCNRQPDTLHCHPPGIMPRGSRNELILGEGHVILGHVRNAYLIGGCRDSEAALTQEPQCRAYWLLFEHEHDFAVRGLAFDHD